MKPVLDEIDYRGKRVILTFKKWKQKSSQHPELLDGKFIKNLQSTIKNPDEVWEELSSKDKACYYKKYSINSYIKVVIWVKGNPAHIVSAFETNYIKEVKYPKLKRLK